MRSEILAAVLVVAIAVAGVLLGLWKIDTIGLILAAGGAAFMFRPGLWRVAGLVLIAGGILMWFDVIGVESFPW